MTRAAETEGETGARRQTNASVLLDLMRGLAALAVLLEHWRCIFFVDFPRLVSDRILLAPFYILCSAGHQAVIVFFVLSGYLISGSVFRLSERGTWSWSLYFSHRLLRLWIVLIPGLLLCALWDRIGLHLGIAPNLYHGRSGNHVVIDVASSYALKTFAANLFFLQWIRAKTFGSDGPLWSLAYEFWYYVLFPLGWFAIRRRTPTRARVVYVLCFAAVSWFVGLKALESFPVWLMGTGLALVPASRIAGTLRLFAGAAYIPLFFLIGWRLAIPQPFPAYILAGITTLLLWLILSARSQSVPSRGVRFSQGLARFSYTLYLVHMPLCVLLAALIIGDTRWRPTPTHLLEGLGILCVLIGYAFLVARLTEFKTGRVRTWLEGRFFAEPHNGRRSASSVV